MNQVDDNYVARRKAHTEPGHEQHHHHHGGVDYNVGRYAPKNGLGKVIVPVNNAEKVTVIVFVFCLKRIVFMRCFTYIFHSLIHSI